MILNQIKVKGFKSISEVCVDLKMINILIGANGAGKSNFIGVFNALNQMLNNNFQLYIARSGGANSFLHNGAKETQQIELYLKFGENDYSCKWQPTEDDNFVFASEIAYWHNPSNPPRNPYSVYMGDGQRESNLESKAHVERVCLYVLRALQNWKVYHFHDTSSSASVKKYGPINDNKTLRADASNLAAFLFLLQQKNIESFNLIQKTIRLVAPFFDKFSLRPNPANEDLVRLEWQEVGSDMPYLAHQLSDGTLRFICLATLLLQPSRPDTIVIDEPELGLHPYAIKILASLVKSAASAGTQIIVSTQSVELLNEFSPDNILVVDRRNSSTEIKRLANADFECWLEDYSLGELWNKNILGGRPSSV